MIYGATREKFGLEINMRCKRKCLVAAKFGGTLVELKALRKGRN